MKERLRGGVERLAYGALVRTVGVRRYFPRRSPLWPSLLIVGAQRSGTTSLQKYLREHPAFLAPVRKEIHYFSRYFDRGPDWYASHFPQTRPGAFTADATPYYLYHPLAARRAGAAVPNARIVVLLRDPVSRARSHFQHEVAKGCEDLTLAEAIDAEPERLAGEVERIMSDPSYQSFAHQHYSYLGRGRYIEQLLRWEEAFGRDQMLILTSEEMFADPQGAFDQVTDFVGVERHRLGSTEIHNSYAKRPVTDAVLDRIAAEVDDDNRRLYEYLGRDLGWRRPPES